MPTDHTVHTSRKLNGPLADFIESFWLLANPTDKPHDIIVLPDGRVDIIFSLSSTGSFQAWLMGVTSIADQVVFQAESVIFAVSLKLSAVEYVFEEGIAGLVNTARELPNGFWDIRSEDLADFDKFCGKLTDTLTPFFSTTQPDSRKQKLFNLLYASNGAVSVQDLADRSGWSSRQINRYFNQYFGISLKAYTTILRFQASFTQIKEGKFFPEQNYADQPHFIREIRRFAGVSPKELNRNENDRFIQFSLLSRK